MSVRKRTWTSKGVERTAYVVDYKDARDKRRLKTFKLKKDAEAFAKRSGVEVMDGVHVAEGDSITVTEAGKLWVKAKARAGREPTTVEQYKAHLRLHIEPFLGDQKLTSLTGPMVRKFEDDLLDAGRSPAMVRKVMVSLGSLLADAVERGTVARNVVQEMRGRRGTSDRRAEKRAKGRLRVGVDIPSPEEIKAIIGALEGRWRPLLLTAIFTGMRASELRGLTWPNVDLAKKVIHVRQRADRFAIIGRPKSEAGERDIPLPPVVVTTLKEWKKTGTKSESGLVFPNLKGEAQAHQPIVRDGFHAAQVRAGVLGTGARTELPVPKYSGLHALRHFYASWCINRPEDGGLGLPAKVVQDRLGHSSITMTLDTYGHLFPRGDDGEEMAAAEALLLA